MVVHTKSGAFAVQYGDDHWFALAYAYLLFGSMKKAAEVAEIPYQTACGWKRDKAQRWAFWTEKAQNKMMSKTLGRLNGILELAIGQIQITLLEGEERVLKDGSIKNVRPPLASLNMIMGTSLDKIHRMGGSIKPDRTEPEQTSRKDRKWSMAQRGREVAAAIREKADIDQKVH